jgi:hypothetical protein
LEAFQLSQPEDEPVIPLTAEKGSENLDVISGDPNHPM